MRPQRPGIVVNTPVNAMTGPYGRRWAALAVLCLSLLIVVMANTALIVAAPDMVRDLGLTSTDLQWVIDGYTVPYAALMLLCGVLGDKYSRRGALLVGLAVFAGGAIFGSLADSTTAVVAARMIMGVGAATIMPATLSLLVATFPKAERARAVAVWAATTGLAIALGPLLAGMLLEQFSWHSTFLINVPISVLAAAGVLVLVPPSRADGFGRIDWVGGALSVLAVGLLVYAVIDGFHFGWGTGPVAAAVGATVALAAFVGWEARHPNPLLEVGKLREPLVGGSALSVGTLMFVAFGAIYFVTQQFQFVLGFGPLETGLRLLPLAVAVSAGSMLSSWISRRFGIRVTIVVGLLVAGSGVLSTTFVDGTSGYANYVALLVLLGAGIGMAAPPATDALMGSFDEDDLGAAGGLNDTAMELGGALGIAVLGSVLATGFKDSIAGFLSSLSLPALTGPQADLVAEAMDAAGDSVGGATLVAEEMTKNPLTSARAGELTNAAAEAFADAVVRASWAGAAALAVGAVVVAIILPRNADRVVTPENTDEGETGRG